MKSIQFKTLIFFFLIFTSCSENGELTSSHQFKDQTWHRFNILHFEIPVDSPGKNYDVSLLLRHTKAYEFDGLDFNMIMTTPSGEERIKEYHMNIKSRDGGFLGNCEKDSCEVIIDLKKQLWLTKGILTLDIENLVPRLKVGGLLSMDVRLRPS